MIEKHGKSQFLVFYFVTFMYNSFIILCIGEKQVCERKFNQKWKNCKTKTSKQLMTSTPFNNVSTNESDVIEKIVIDYKETGTNTMESSEVSSQKTFVLKQLENV